jgi:hypothetical protein
MCENKSREKELIRICIFDTIIKHTRIGTQEREKGVGGEGGEREREREKVEDEWSFVALMMVVLQPARLHASYRSQYDIIY